MVSWIATAYGALDLRKWAQNETAIEIMLLSTLPSEPMGLQAEPAKLWLKLVEGPVNYSDLDAYERHLILGFEEAGIASADHAHPARIRHVSAPWMQSPGHELVYSLVANIARREGILVAFIKGPPMWVQGLRERQHSGDVDAWVDPRQLNRLGTEIAKWGWQEADGLWEKVSTHHSLTMKPIFWGCEIDLHRHMPGCDLSDQDLFELLSRHLSKMEFAGVMGKIPVLPAQAVLAALHEMRPSRWNEATQKSVDSAVKYLKMGGHAAAEFGISSRSVAALHVPMRLAFPEHDFLVDYKPPINWTWRDQKSRVSELREGFRTVPMRDKPRFLFRIIWPSSSDLMLSDVRSGGDGKNLFKARSRRALRIFNAFRK